MVDCFVQNWSQKDYVIQFILLKKNHQFIERKNKDTIYKIAIACQTYTWDF